MQGNVMLPDLESLRCFVAAAELLNFRAAARQVALSPAALSQRIKALEELLDTSLFERTTRRVHLTGAGLSLYPVAKKTIECAAECLLSVQSETGRFPISITIGTRHELGLSWLIPCLPHLHTEHPGLQTNTYFGSGSDLEDRVRSRQIDCAITSKPVNDAVFSSIRIHREDYVFVSHPALISSVQEVDFRQCCLIDSNADLPLYSYFRDAQQSPGSHPFESYRYMGTIEAIRLVVLQGSGIAVLPRYLVEDDLNSIALVNIFPNAPIRHDWFRLIFRADDPRRVLFESIVQTMQKHPLK